MTASQIRDESSTRERGGLTALAVPYVVAAALLLIAPLGAGWLHVPAVPEAKLPAMTLSFGDIHTLTSTPGPVPTNGIQEGYFAWLGWALIAVTVLLIVATLALRQPALGRAVAAASLCALVCTVFSVKGPLSWPDFIDQVPNIRIGGYLLLAGYVLAIVTSLLVARGRRAQI